MGFAIQSDHEIPCIGNAETMYKNFRAVVDPAIGGGDATVKIDGQGIMIREGAINPDLQKKITDTLMAGRKVTVESRGAYGTHYITGVQTEPCSS